RLQSRPGRRRRPQETHLRARRQSPPLWRSHEADERAARRRLSQDRIGGARTRGIVAMTSPAYSMTRTELWRWGLSFVAILALHCGIAAAIIIKPAEGDVLDNIEAIEVDF